MKHIKLILALTIATVGVGLSGCGHTHERETRERVIEKQPVVEKERTVIDVR